MRFLSGTDDNALKNVDAALAAGLPVAQFVAAKAQRFVELAGDLSGGLNPPLGHFLLCLTTSRSRNPALAQEAERLAGRPAEFGSDSTILAVLATQAESCTSGRSVLQSNGGRAPGLPLYRVRWLAHALEGATPAFQRSARPLSASRQDAQT